MTIAGMILPLLLFSATQGQSKTGEQVKKQWGVYTNVRFQYAICYPKNIFTPQGETANSSGNTFHGAHGEELVVNGENTDFSLTELRQTALTATQEHFGKVTYTAKLKDAFVISAENQTSILYSKTFLSEGQSKQFDLTYPKSEKLQFDKIAADLGGCFSDLFRSPKITYPQR